MFVIMSLLSSFNREKNELSLILSTMIVQYEKCKLIIYLHSILVIGKLSNNKAISTDVCYSQYFYENIISILLYHKILNT